MPDLSELIGKYLFGVVFVIAGLFILASQYVFPGSLNPEIYPVGYVLLLMGSIALFPRQYMRLVSPSLGNITNDLVNHLNQIGVKAAEIKLDSPEAIKRGTKVFGNDQLDVPPWGVIKVEGRNIEFVEPLVMNLPGGGGGTGKRRADAINVIISYLLRAEIGDEDDYAATNNPNWEGGRVADLLNADEELKKMQEGLGQPRIRVKGYKADSYVSISRLDRGESSRDSMVKTFGLRDFPSAEEFAVYDRIAGHVKSMQAPNTTPINTEK